MKYRLKKFIRFFVLSATFVVLEFAAPVFSQPVDAAVFIANRDLMGAGIMTTSLPPRDICEMIVCEPTYRITKSSIIMVTAYSSTPDQTSGNPFITASGTHVHTGTFAINGIPFGTKLRIPDHFGDQIFIVEDRMHSRYGTYRGDIWMETRNEAIQWGARSIRIEFVEEV